MTATYDRHGLQFLFPENWTMTEDQVDADPISISLQSPTTGFWSLHVHRPPQAVERLLEEVVRAMREEYEQLDSHPRRDGLAKIDLAGYDLEFHCLDFVVQSRIMAFEHPTGSYLIQAQAVDAEFDQYEAVFMAMTVSLLKSLSAS